MTSPAATSLSHADAAGPAPGGVLALDLGRHLGGAYASPQARAAWPDLGGFGKGPIEGVAYGSADLGPSGTGRIESERLVKLFRFVDRIFAAYGPAHVVFERPFIDTKRPSIGQQQNVKLAGVVDAQFAAKGCVVWQGEISTIKKHFAGHGRAQKEDVMHVCQRRGWSPATFDVADALAVLDYGVCFLRNEAKREGRAA